MNIGNIKKIAFPPLAGSAIGVIGDNLKMRFSVVRKVLYTFLYQNKRGFTLLEILVAALIMALVITGLAYVFLAGKRHLLHARSRIQAAELGRLFLTPLQMQVRRDQWASNCLGSDTGCPSTPTDDITIDGTRYKPSSTVTQNYSGTTLSKVKLTISWDEITP